MYSESIVLIMPLVIALITVAAYLITLYRKIGTIPVLDAGTLAVLFTSLYVIVPLVGFLLCGMELDVLKDQRLITRQPSAESISAVAWRFDLYLVALCCAYLLFRQWAGEVATPPGSLNPRTAMVLFCVWTTFTLLFVLLAVNGSFPSLAKYEDILEAYSSRLKWALWQQQVVNHFEGMYVLVKLALLMFVMERYEKWRWRIFLYLLVAVEVCLPLFFGSRTSAVLFCLGLLLFFSRQVRPLKTYCFIGIGGLGLFIFLWIGVLRIRSSHYGDLVSVLMSNEFLSVFVNVYDLYYRIIELQVELPQFFHFFELLLVVPQQLLPFAKLDPAMWYVSLMGPQDIRPGQGLAFGVVAQSLIGFDHFELIVRGVFTGAVLAVLHRAYVAHATSFIWVLFYVWLCVHAYLTVRLYTFALVPKYVFQFMPIAGLIMLLEHRLSIASRTLLSGTMVVKTLKL